MKALSHDSHQITPEVLEQHYKGAVLYMPTRAASDPRPTIIKLRYRRHDRVDRYIFELVHEPQNEISLCIRPDGLIYLLALDCETRLFDNYWFAYGWALRSMRKSWQ